MWARGLTCVDVWLNCKRDSKGTGRSGSRGFCKSGCKGSVKTATEVGVRAIQDHKVIEWNTCWKCRLSEGTDDM